MTGKGPGPRDYAVATERALYAFSGATCYFPDCKIPVIVFVGDEAVSNVEIAHIRGANPGSPRFDSTMTDEERRAFANVILLCKPHHEIVDKRHPEKYPAETLSEWKLQREVAAGIDATKLAGITEDRLVALIEKAVASARGERIMSVELGLGFATPGQALVFPAAIAKKYLDLDMYKDLGPKVLIVTVRNSGALKAYVESHAVRFSPADARLSGPNHFPFLNPRMPAAIDGGESIPWFYDLATVTKMVAFFLARNASVDALVGEIRLGSGELVASEPLAVQYLPL
jgi:hypothetical protein